MSFGFGLLIFSDFLTSQALMTGLAELSGYYRILKGSGVALPFASVSPFVDLLKMLGIALSVSVPLCGVIERGLERALPGRSLTPLTAEFGTHEPARVFWAARADNWLHHHGEPESDQGRAIQEELLEVFCPADPGWRARVLDQGAALLRSAAGALGSR